MNYTLEETRKHETNRRLRIDIRQQTTLLAIVSDCLSKLSLHA
jgi:hypothetical protein